LLTPLMMVNILFVY